MDAALSQRPKWSIDRVLERLVGQDVRVAAEAFAPPNSNHGYSGGLICVRGLMLPDNSQPAGLPVFFEGRLCHFERHIGVVFVWLDAPASLETASEGSVFFRGQTAVILRGPAVVELTFPFQVEKLPVDPRNYWQDLRVPRAQFEFPFPGDDGSDSNGLFSVGSQAPPVLPASIQAPRPSEQRSAPVDSPPSLAVDRGARADAVEGEACWPERERKPTPIPNSNCSPSTH